MSPSIWQILLVLVLVLILFGAGKLPRVMGDIAKGVKNFKAGLRDPDENETAAETPTKEVSHDATEAAPVAKADVTTDEPAKT